MTDGATVQVQLPYQLQSLAQCPRQVGVEIPTPGAVSVGSVIRALEARYPMLRGAIIDHYTAQRRPKVRFFACGEDYSLTPLDTTLPAAVQSGAEPLIIIGAISGG